VITLADAAPGDEDKVAALCAELNGYYYGDVPEGTLAERAAVVRDVLFGVPPLAYALLAWDGLALAGFAAYSFLWPAAGLSASLYLKELYVAFAYRRAGVGRMLMDGLGAVAARRGLSRMEWTTDTSNRGAQAFYEALGAKRLASKVFYRVTGDGPEGPVGRPLAC
jgi:ribosomal protein S18 acetylase RimI-like enzyme